MNQRTLLKKTMSLARTGDAEAFQNFYILTVQESYGKLYAFVKEEELARELLVELYVRLYQRVDTLPVDEEELAERIEEEIYRVVEKRLGEELNRPVFDGDYENLNEETAVTLWIRIEEKAKLSQEEPEEDKSTFDSYLYSLMKVAVTVFILILTAVVIYKGWRWFSADRGEMGSPAAAESSAESSSESVVIAEGEQLIPGWEQKPDGKLYYTLKSGRLADGPVAIGKQTLTFSRNGELTMIGVNTMTADNHALTFDEQTRYEVRSGDIYRQDPDSEEVCVVRNGHVIQADARCGYLWYVSQYQIPNSSQVKTTIYRADPDGGKEEELYTTDSILETENFQITSHWLYYLADGSLFRKNIDTGEAEFMAREVEYYFAWEDTAYYMKDRTLESVSEGSDYSGTEEGYRIELQERGLVILDETGTPVLDGENGGNGEVQAGDRIYRLENGVIKSVRPAERRQGEITYYIDDAGTDRKLYQKDGDGTRGLLRQEGLVVDSFCIAGEWLFYSARVQQYGAEYGSQIYRLNLQTMELERYGEPFRGFMRNLYYFDNVQAIFGEYIPSVVLPDEIHGEIGMITLDGGIRQINADSVRPESDGSDMLEMVMAEGDRIYCLYHRCSYDSYSGQMAWETTVPLEIGLGRNEVRNGAEDD